MSKFRFNKRIDFNSDLNISFDINNKNKSSLIFYSLSTNDIEEDKVVFSSDTTELCSLLPSLFRNYSQNLIYKSPNFIKLGEDIYSCSYANYNLLFYHQEFFEESAEESDSSDLIYNNKNYSRKDNKYNIIKGNSIINNISSETILEDLNLGLSNKFNIFYILGNNDLISLYINNSFNTLESFIKFSFRYNFKLIDVSLYNKESNIFDNFLNFSINKKSEEIINGFEMELKNNIEINNITIGYKDF